MLKDVIFTIFDLEWETVSREKHFILEIGALKMQNGKILGKFNKLLKYLKPIHPAVSELTGITKEMLKYGEDRENSILEFLLFIEGTVLVAHDIVNDMMVLNEEADRLGLEVPNPQICTLKLSRQNFLLERYNLLAVARFLGVENLHKKHRAYKDAYVLHKIFEKILLNLPKKIDTTEKIINFKRGEKQLFSAEFYDINLNKKLNYRGFFDGASAGNPGRMGTGFAIFDKKEQLIFEHSEYIGIGTNNEAEYQAFIFLLEFATLNKIENLEIFGDSKLVIMQVTGQWKVKAENLRPYVIKAKKLIEQIPNCSIKWIARDKNSVADKLSKDGVNASDEYEY